jgi:hypothetical protein
MVHNEVATQKSKVPASAPSNACEKGILKLTIEKATIVHDTSSFMDKMDP